LRLNAIEMRSAALHRKAEMRRIHHRAGSARIEEFERPAQRRIGGDAAVIDIVDPGPEGAGMGVGQVAVAAAIDVGPHVGAPRHGENAGMGPPAGVARAVDRHAIGGVAGDGQQLQRRHAAPALHVPGRLPAPFVGSLLAGMGLLALLDDPSQVGIQRGRVRHVVDDERRGEQRYDF
jgi:hypothetical protein